MMARRGVLGLLLGGAAALLSACKPFGNPGYRFKMTVEVDTPEGLRTGSSVYEIETVGSRDLVAGGKGSRFTLRGEAVAVDLPNGRTLFALLKTVAQSGHNDLGVSSMIAMDPAFDYDWMASTKKIAIGDGIVSPADVSVAYYPMLVMFKDIGDPKTVMPVDPADLAASFGAGVMLRRIAVEVTDEAVTTGVGKRLGWLSEYRNKTFAGNRFAKGNSLADTLGQGSFVIGGRK